MVERKVQIPEKLGFDGLLGKKVVIYCQGVARAAFRRLPLSAALKNRVRTFVRGTRNSTRDEGYQRWIRSYDTLSDKDRKAIREAIAKWRKAPRISIIMPVYNSPEAFLLSAIDSVTSQLYPNWELCIADDASPDPHVRKVLEEAARKDARIKVVFCARNGHIAKASNEAIAIASGQYIALLDHDDTLSEHALYWLAAEIMANPEVDLLYSDEDKLDERGERVAPFFKPNWSPHLAVSQAYLGHLVCFSSRVLRRMNGELFDGSVNGSQDYDAWLRVSLHAKVIRHIPKILYHWRMHNNSTAQSANAKGYAHDAGRKAVERYIGNRYPGYAVSVKNGEYAFTYSLDFHLRDDCSVTIVIPTRDHGDLLRTCVESIREKSSWKNFDIIIVDNGSTDLATLSYLREIAREWERVQVMRVDEPFNWSRLNNLAAAKAKGDVLVFLNNDTAVITGNWLECLAGYALLPDVGVVGGLLLFGDGLIQHSGVVVGMGGWADHVFRDTGAEHRVGPFVSPVLTRNVLAVTGACLAIQRSKFEQVGGFDEEFIVCGSDVELGLRIQKRGYWNVLCTEARLYHWESKTRDPSNIPESDYARSAEKYRPYREEEVDPFFNRNLDLSSTAPMIKGNTA